MKKATLLAALVMAATAGTASAGGSPGSLGLGAEYALTSVNLGALGTAGIGGVSLNYDAGDFHVGGLLGFSDGDGANNTDFVLGGRFYYHVHSTAMADFGVGGALSFFSEDGPDPDGRASLMFLEPGIQIRAFITPNVALSFTAGIAIGVVDASGISIGGQATGSAGIHYYFF